MWTLTSSRVFTGVGSTQGSWDESGAWPQEQQPPNHCWSRWLERVQKEKQEPSEAGLRHREQWFAEDGT